MGPDEFSLSLADTILADHPSITVSRIELAYSIMGWAEKNPPEDGRHD